MRRLILLLTVIAATLAALVVVALPAGAVFPGHNGRIVFWREDSNGFVQTWVADKDLSDQTKITSRSANSGWAVWKPGAPNWPSIPIAPTPIPPILRLSTTSSR